VRSGRQKGVVDAPRVPTCWEHKAEFEQTSESKLKVMSIQHYCHPSVRFCARCREWAFPTLTRIKSGFSGEFSVLPVNLKSN
jgi:hypothetical protein